MAGFWVRGISLEGFEVGTRTFPSWGGGCVGGFEGEVERKEGIEVGEKGYTPSPCNFIFSRIIRATLSIACRQIFISSCLVFSHIFRARLC